MRAARRLRKTHLFRWDALFCSACGAKARKPYRSCPACGRPMKRAKADASRVDEAERPSVLPDDDW